MHSQLRYEGRSFFTEIHNNPQQLTPTLTFTASRFIVQTPLGISVEPEQLQPLLDSLYRERAREKFPARVRRHWELKTGFKANGIRIRLSKVAGPVAMSITYWSLIQR